MKRRVEYVQEMIDSDESLNVYGSLGHHHEVTIVGTSKALIHLRDLIDEAVVHGQVKGHYWPHDREGHELYVYALDDEAEWAALCDPYPIAVTRGGRLRYYGELTGGKHPVTLFEAGEPDGE